jgi:Tfp pilus assembly protein PilO
MNVLLNRLRWWALQHLGWPGLLGLGLVLLAALLAWQAMPALEAEQADMLHKKVAQMALQRQRSDALVRAGRDPRDEMRDGLPSLKDRGRLIDELLQELEKSGLSPDRVDYSVQIEEPRLSRLRVTLPATGNYVQLRRFMALTLNHMPNAALDSMQIDRNSGPDPSQLRVVLHLSLFFRSDL